MSTSTRLRRIAAVAAIASMPLVAALPLGADAVEAGVYYDGTGRISLKGTAGSEARESGDSVFLPTGDPIAGSPLVVRG